MEDEKVQRTREANAADSTRKETVIQIPLTDLHPFPNHPFKVREDESMKETTASVKEFGVFTPAIVRPRKEGGYEIISGHRRKRACELADIKTMPAIVRNMDDNMAVIAMVDSNLQRENILPSERAWAYKMKLDAIKRQGARTDLTSPHVAARFRSDDEIARKEGVSGDTIRRYIRLTELTPSLLRMVDEKKMSLTPAVEISYLKPEEQTMLADAIESEQSAPSLSQAQRMRQLSRWGALDKTSILAIMMEEKKTKQYDLTISGEKLRKYFPATSTPREMEETILKLLDAWQRGKRRDRGR